MKFLTLMQDYLQLTFERLASLESLIQQVKIKPSTTVWQKLENLVHKIGGSTGMYGRLMASELCKKMEMQLKNKDHSRLDLDRFYQQLYLFIQ